MTIKICGFCGVEYTPKSRHVGRSKYCGLSCFADHQRALAALRPPRPKRVRSAVPLGYMSWRGMKVRCNNPKQPEFKNYGARGISVCARWMESFAAFIEDMGPRPSAAHSIDRIDNDGNYEPGNCRWATHEEQSRNRRNTYLVTVDGVADTIAGHAKARGIDPDAIYHRTKNLGLDIASAFAIPVKRGNRNLAAIDAAPQGGDTGAPS